MTKTTAMIKPRRREPPTRTIVKVTYQVSIGRYRVCAAGGRGMEHRHRHRLPGHLLEALDKRGKVFAFAVFNRSTGHWHLEQIAPEQWW